MYRLIIESLLGLTLDVDRLRFTPILPLEWPEFALRYRYRETYYDIVVRGMDAERDQQSKAVNVAIDGVIQAANFVLLTDDRQPHSVEVRVPRDRAS